MKKDITSHMADIKYDIDWSTLDQYLSRLERQGVSPNVASFVGATTLRVHEVGFDDRRAETARASGHDGNAAVEAERGEHVDGHARKTRGTVDSE